MSKDIEGTEADSSHVDDPHAKKLIGIDPAEATPDKATFVHVYIPNEPEEKVIVPHPFFKGIKPNECTHCKLPKEDPIHERY